VDESRGLVLLAAMILLGVRHIHRFELFSIRAGECAYRDASFLAASTVPDRSLIVSMQMSDALKYYTSRPIARWDAIRPEDSRSFAMPSKSGDSAGTPSSGLSRRRASGRTCRGARSGSGR